MCKGVWMGEPILMSGQSFLILGFCLVFLILVLCFWFAVFGSLFLVLGFGSRFLFLCFGSWFSLLVFGFRSPGWHGIACFFFRLFCFFCTNLLPHRIIL